MPFYAKSAGHVTRPYIPGYFAPQGQIPGYEVDVIFVNPNTAQQSHKAMF